MLYSNSKRVDSERMSAEILSLKDRILGYQETIKGLQGSLRSAEKAKARQEHAYEVALAEKDAIIKELITTFGFFRYVSRLISQLTYPYVIV